MSSDSVVPRLISSVPKNGNLKFGKNAPYLTHFPETLKFQIANPWPRPDCSASNDGRSDMEAQRKQESV